MRIQRVGSIQASIYIPTALQPSQCVSDVTLQICHANNLCDIFSMYALALQPGKPLIIQCKPSLPNVPGFHNASLYDALQPSISPLVGLLRDEEDKTRANAAGALGNLVRNSAALCGELVRAGALAALLATAAAPERAPPAGVDSDPWRCL